MKTWILLLQGLVGSTALPTPSAAQLRYQKQEIIALTHFGMETFANQGCKSWNWAQTQHPSTFWPTHLNTSNWVESYVALGAKAAILTVKHDCGFYLWPSNVTLPTGAPYGYHVFGKGGIHRDVAREFVEAVDKAGLGHGLYYSLGHNFYVKRLGRASGPNAASAQASRGSLLPGQVCLTDDQYDDLVIDSLRELWGKYHNMSEIWFDGGVPERLEQRISDLVQKYESDSVLFGAHITRFPNAVNWIGTENGLPSYPVWSSGCMEHFVVNGDGSHGGSPAVGKHYCPKVSDITMIKDDDDIWFFDPQAPLKSLEDLIMIYHHTVGAGATMEVDFAIDFTGNVNPQHAARYKEFGDWIRGCYGDGNHIPVSNTSTTGDVTEVILQKPSLIDRVVLQEDVTKGEVIVSYKIEVQTSGSQGRWLPFQKGLSVGYKRIALATKHFANVTQIRVTTKSVATPSLSVAPFGPCFPCTASVIDGEEQEVEDEESSPQEFKPSDLPLDTTKLFLLGLGRSLAMKHRSPLVISAVMLATGLVVALLRRRAIRSHGEEEEASLL